MAESFKPITVEDLGLTEEQKRRIVRGLPYLREPELATVDNSVELPEIEPLE